jgi:hypothetical protein
VNPAEWTPRELRHSFVSLLSDNGMSLKERSPACAALAGLRQRRPVHEPGRIAVDLAVAG